MIDGPATYPEYLTDDAILVCPSDSDGNNRYINGRWNIDGDLHGLVVPGRRIGVR